MDGARENNPGEQMGEAAREIGETTASAAERVGERLEQGRTALVDIQGVLAEKTRECVHTTDVYVRDNPWQAVGLAAGVGLVVGLVIGRR